MRNGKLIRAALAGARFAAARVRSTALRAALQVRRHSARGCARWGSPGTAPASVWPAICALRAAVRAVVAARWRGVGPLERTRTAESLPRRRRGRCCAVPRTRCRGRTVCAARRGGCTVLRGRSQPKRSQPKAHGAHTQRSAPAARSMSSATIAALRDQPWDPDIRPTQPAFLDASARTTCVQTLTFRGGLRTRAGGGRL